MTTQDQFLHWPRNYGKTYLTAAEACYRAKYLYKGKPFIIVVPDENEKHIYYEQVISITKGAWPIGLKIKTTDELFNLKK